MELDYEISRTFFIIINLRSVVGCGSFYLPSLARGSGGGTGECDKVIDLNFLILLKPQPLELWIEKIQKL